MESREKLYFNWSTGKDAALALYKLQQAGEFDIDLLLTTINKHYDRVTMHGLRRELLEAQTKAIGLKATTIELPEQPSMEVYGNIMRDEISELRRKGYEHCAFGDIFLEDLREYREQQLAPHGIKAIFPLWKQDTRRLMNEFLDLGFKAIVVCAKAEYFDQDFAGSILDKKLLAKLPKSVDPCGENGEFHTFCFDGPIFKHPVDFELGEKVYRSYPSPDDKNEEVGFWYCDLKTLQKPF